MRSEGQPFKLLGVVYLMIQGIEKTLMTPDLGFMTEWIMMKVIWGEARTARKGDEFIFWSNYFLIYEKEIKSVRLK